MLLILCLCLYLRLWLVLQCFVANMSSACKALCLSEARASHREPHDPGRQMAGELLPSPLGPVLRFAVAPWGRRQVTHSGPFGDEVFWNSSDPLPFGPRKRL